MSALDLAQSLIESDAEEEAELAVYALITGATISTTTFNAGTYLNVWGRNDD